MRLIEDDPSDLFDPSRMFSSVREWRFHDVDQGLAGWALANPEGANWAVTPRGLHLESEQGRVLLVLNDELSGGDFDAVEVELHPVANSAATGTVSLAWARQGEPLSGAREIIEPDRLWPSAQPHIYRFPLRAHPAWQPGASRLRLAFHHPPAGVVLGRISFVHASPIRESPASPENQRAKAALGNELRPAVIGVPGASIRWPVEIPEGATLRFSYGIPPSGSLPLRFRAWFVPSRGARTELFEDVLETREDLDRWHQASVDLAPLAGSSGHVELEASLVSPSGSPGGYGLWGNPRITLSHRRQPNVLLISVDTLRPDRMSLYGYDRRTSPVLDEWAQSAAAVFESAIAQSTWTLPSHVSMLTGTDAFHHGVNYSDDVAPDSLVFVQETLRQAGYYTMAITGGALMHPRYGFHQGFDQYWSYPGNRATGEELSEGLRRAVEWLDDAEDAPFFLLFHTYEVHTPWRSRQPWFEEFSNLPPVEDLRVRPPEPREEQGFLGVIDDSHLDFVRPTHVTGLTKSELLELASDAYDSGIAYTDVEIGRLLSTMEARGLLEDTIVVFTSDHGEMLGEHGVLGHRYLYEENIRVPLVIALPDGAGAGRRVEPQVRSVDIVPTVLDAIGLEVPPGLDGQSLMPLVRATEDPHAPVATEAWTYAPEVNYGISLRVDNRLKYTFNDTAWAPLNGSEGVFLLEDPLGEANDILQTFDGVDALYASMYDKVADLPGLRIRLRSNSGQRSYGAIEGLKVRPNRVKSIDLPCPCVRWEPQRAIFDVPPGTEYTLMVQGGATDAYVVQLTGAVQARGTEKEHELRVEIDITALKEHLSFALTDAGWQELSSQSGVTPNVEIWWQGQIATGSDPGIDGQLIERLRALGYLR